MLKISKWAGVGVEATISVCYECLLEGAFPFFLSFRKKRKKGIALIFTPDI
jgi:hypothetical protein